MNSLSLPDDSSFLQFNPLTLLAQVAGQKNSGCLMVYCGSQAWRLYLEEGELIYASAVQQAFDRLEFHLRQMGRSMPSLASAVRVQVRLLFETRQSRPETLSPDYQAIQWLLEQQYLTAHQAASLVEILAQEAMQSLLAISTGSYNIIDRSQFDDWFSVCRLNLRQLIQSCSEESKPVRASTKLGLVDGGSPVVPFVPMAAPRGPAPSQTTFYQTPFEAPAARDPASVQSFALPQSFAPPSSPSREVPSPEHQRYRVVCVDDSPTILKLIHSYLEEDDFSVIMINDPVRALMQVVRCKPDLVLLDVEMPSLDGYELCSLLRRHPAFKSIPIVMVTGNTGFVDRARARLVGASGYLTKPFSRSELLKMVFRNLPVLETFGYSLE